MIFGDFHCFKLFLKMCYVFGDLKNMILMILVNFHDFQLLLILFDIIRNEIGGAGVDSEAQNEI